MATLIWSEEDVRVIFAGDEVPQMPEYPTMPPFSEDQKVGTVAEQHWQQLANAQPGCRPGNVYIGSCEDALQWAGRHVEFVVNCADVQYAFHPWCVGYWLTSMAFTAASHHLT